MSSTTVVPSTSSSTVTSKGEPQLEKVILGSTNIKSINVVSNPPPGQDLTKTSTSEIQEKAETPNDANYKREKPKEPELALKYEICVPYTRFPLTLKKLRKVSTFIPIAINYFKVVHYMDTLMTSNVYFTRLGLPWHPLLSRLYFAILFYVQTLRAMRYAKLGSSQTRTFIEQLLRDYPPESLPIPGPLLPILKSICCSTSDDPIFGLICPVIPEDIGVEEAEELLDLDTQDFVLPHVPAICDFLNKIIHAENEVPDFSDSTMFDDSEERTLCGHVFEANDWQNVERLTLLSPGLNELIESTPELDDQMHHLGNELDIPQIEAGSNLKGIENYLLLNENSTWLHNVIDVMATYCSFFKESSTLSACSPQGPSTSLVMSSLRQLTSPNAANNIAVQLDHAFPGTYPFELNYTHKSYELAIPQIYQLMGEYSAINTSVSYRGLPFWGDFNNVNSGRSGPYWNQNPPNLQSTDETALIEVEAIIADNYFIPNPSENK